MPLGISKNKPRTRSARMKTLWMNPEYRKHMSDIHKGKKGFWLGKKRPLETVKKMQTTHILRKKIGSKHPNWKGMDIQYVSKHQWIYKHYGKATLCENPECIYPRKNKSRTWIRSAKIFHWANISGEYKRGISDYIQLCVSCHGKWDNGKPSLKLNIKEIKKNSTYRQYKFNE